jgi:D-beta-D-heptose 7-phosphate kinase/D-beta-D-heptose 1-phosphate adenosyltransferase
MTYDYDKLIQGLDNFNGKTVLVIGDLILDKFVRGRVSRISPEAPVPVVEITEEEYMPGGAGNVVSNIISLGGKVSMCGIVGEDNFGQQLISELSGMGSDVSGILKDETRPTSQKTRIIAEHQQVVRADLESKEEIDERFETELVSWIESIISKIDGVVISDYGKGLVTSNLIEKVIEHTNGKNIPVVVDPQVGHFFEYKNVTAITPNVKEAGEALNIRITDEEKLEYAGRKLLEDLNCDLVMVTRGEKGMTLFYKSGEIKNIPTMAPEVYDVSGAGDTVSSVFTLGVTAGLDYYDAAVLSNYAAAVVVGKLGTATTSIEEIKKEMEK